MINTGFESRVKIQQIVDSQLPEFVVSESPKTIDFLKQYYISQEFQGGTVDISDNLDQYLKLDNLTSDVVVGSTTLAAGIGTENTSIEVSSTKGFPTSYGLLKIDDEIITYTGIAADNVTFTGCKRGFSGITSYHNELKQEDLIFSSSEANSHVINSKIQNLSSLFLQEFYKKQKYTYTPGLEDANFHPNVNVGNFIKESRAFYESKGTDESFRILFNVLYGETPKIVNLEQFLIKPSSADYIRREVIIGDPISGDISNLVGQTIYKLNDSNTNATISEVEPITRIGIGLTSSKIYYKISLFIGYDDTQTNIQGDFQITPSSLAINTVGIGASSIIVDSTVGFGVTGKLVSGINTNINYTSKTVNQFFGCTGIGHTINIADTVRNDEIYYGYENGDLTKKVEFRLNGVLSEFEQVSKTVDIDEGEIISVKNLGDLIINPIVNRTDKEIFANSWIYNTSSRYQIESYSSAPAGGASINFYQNIDRSGLKNGDNIEVLNRNSNDVAEGTNGIIPSDNYITGIGASDPNAWWGVKTKNITAQLFPSGSPSELGLLDVRRKLHYPSSTGAPLYNPNATSDVSNLYVDDENELFYIASNSLPSSGLGDENTNYTIKIDTPIIAATGVALTSIVDEPSTIVGVLTQYSQIQFNNEVPFLNGDVVRYQPSGASYIGLEANGFYYVGIASDSNNKKRIRLYKSPSHINSISSDYIKLAPSTKDPSETGHKFVLDSQKINSIGPQKLFKKFPFKSNIANGNSEETTTQTTGMLINGVEIANYKSNDKIYYGPIEKINILSSGSDYDCVNLPQIHVASGTGNTAYVQPVISGPITEVFIDPQGYSIDDILSINVTGGNGDAVLEPLITTESRGVEFDARLVQNSGGINTTTETITFLTDHGFINQQEVIYKSGDGDGIGIGIGTSTLVSNASYFVNVIDNNTIKLSHSRDKSLSNDTINLGVRNNAGIHEFVTLPNDTKRLSGIRVVDGGTFTNRKLKVKPTGISTEYNKVTFKNHGFNHGDQIVYQKEPTGTIITGLTTSTGITTTINYYQIFKIDDDNFKLTNSGIGKTIISNFENQNFVDFATTGSGYQNFSYPDIEVSVQYSSIGLGTVTQTVENIVSTPTVKGSIIDSYVYEAGTGYGSTIINYKNSPIITIKNGKDCAVKPIITNGKILSVSIEYGGTEYFSIPSFDIVDSSGQGSGAILKPVIVDGRIDSVTVINPGIGYSSTDTSIRVVSSGKNALLEALVRPLTIDIREKFNVGKLTSSDYSDEILLDTINNQLQYNIVGYSSKYRKSFGEFGTNVGSGQTIASTIIGWAYDGNPIYGSYGYDNPGIAATSRRMESGYTKSISNITDRPVGFDLGFFIEDWKFDDSGDLDIHNGRFGKTPEFPDGVYAYFATIDSNGIPEFPYFIGDSYRSLVVNQNLNQDYDFKNSNLVRNTFPYRVSEKYIDNDFIIETNEIEKQKTVVETVSSGSIDNIVIIDSGDNYRINDTLDFDDTGTDGNGLETIVKDIKGQSVVNVSTAKSVYEASHPVIISKDTDEQLRVYIEPSHDWNQGDRVTLSGFSLSGVGTTAIASVDGSYTIGVSSEVSSLIQPLAANVGVTTEIYVDRIPGNISIGSTIEIGNESLKLLNIFKNESVLRVKRGTVGISHTATSVISFVPDSFTIQKPFELPLDSRPNHRTYFNPLESVGYGNTAGISISRTFNFGSGLITRDIQTQSIYIPSHPFTDNQKITLENATGGSQIQYTATSGSTAEVLPSTLYVSNLTPNSIGIKTGIGTTSGEYSDVFFKTGGDNLDTYNFRTTFNTEQGTAAQYKATVSISTDRGHNMVVGDIVDLTVTPSQSVGIGTSLAVEIRRDTFTGYLHIDPTNTNSFIRNYGTRWQVIGHKFVTGDKVYYDRSTGTNFPNGIPEGAYYVYVINEDWFSLCKTYEDAIATIPVILQSTSGGQPQLVNRFSKINPPIKVVKTNSLVFDLSHSSLQDYKFKVYYDKEFKNEYASSELKDFNVTYFGVIGVSTNATVSIGYTNTLPQNLYYTLEKSGGITTSDTSVKNYSQIEYVDSKYNGKYDIISVGSTTEFTVSLPENPEKVEYTSTDSDITYTTNSLTESGGINNVRIISDGVGYKKLPNFVGSGSTFGNGGYVVAESKVVGNVKNVRIINEGFEYSSDSTLVPSAYISPFIVIKDSNTIGIITVTNGGSDYSIAPNIKIVNSITREEIGNDGMLKPTLGGSGISNIEVVAKPSGLPDTAVELFAVNNSNGIGIVTMSSNNTGIFTCYITTPSNPPLSWRPFEVGDDVFIENVVSYGTTGTGFNSKDNQYRFAKVTNVASGLSTAITLDYSGVSTSVGFAATDQQSIGQLINKKLLPTFSLTKVPQKFIVGESLVRNSIRLNLTISISENDYIKVFGKDSLVVGDIITGVDSGVIATVNSITDNLGKYKVKFSVKKDIGWSDDIGKLSSDNQVTPDNDYYQNLSYTIQSSKGFDELRSPVSSLLHTSGLKNFADTGITSDAKAVGSTNTDGVRTGIGSTDVSFSTQDVIEDNRIDTIYNYDLANDLTTNNINSKFISLQNKKLTDYTLAKSNEVLVIDNIENLFSNLAGSPSEYLDLIKLDGNIPVQTVFYQISNLNKTNIQTSEISILDNGTNQFLVQTHELADDTAGVIGSFEISSGVDPYLRFIPKPDAYDYDYDLKSITSTYSPFSSGIGTFNIGLIAKEGFTGIATAPATPGVSPTGITTTIITSEPKGNRNGYYVRTFLTDKTTNDMNYVESYITHDGAHTYISEFFIDTKNQINYSNTLMGEIKASVDANNFTLTYENSSSNEISINSDIIGIGLTSVGINTYRFKATGQPDQAERTAIYQSNYAKVNGLANPGAGTTYIDILGVGNDLSLTDFNSGKSWIEISNGSRSALHQLEWNYDGTNAIVQQGPILSQTGNVINPADTGAGIGTFAALPSGSNLTLRYYHDSNWNDGTAILAKSLNLLIYNVIDEDNLTITNDFNYGTISQKIGANYYNALNGDRINRTKFKLTSGNVPIFGKVFDPVSSAGIVSHTTGIFNISNHNFRTGEELVYKPDSSFIGIGSTAMQYETNTGIVTTLPSTIFAIRNNSDSFQIATTRVLANAGTAVTFVGPGEGNSHEISMALSNTKCLINLDNIIQSPLAFSPVSHTLQNNIDSVLGSTGIGTTSTIFSVSGISSLAPEDILKIDDEYVKVLDIGIGDNVWGPITGIGTTSLINVERGFVGTSATAHTNTTTAQLYKGSYNIIGQQIHFTNPPKGNPQISKTTGNLDFPTTDFNGRVFLRDDYSTNQIYDDISYQFSGIATQFTLKVGGANTVGLGTTGGNGMMVINSIYQRPSAANNQNQNFEIIEQTSPTGITSVRFTGIATVPGDEIVINDSDINENQLPRGGVIVSLGSTEGKGYAVPEGAIAYAQTNASGGISSIVGFATTGPSYSITTATYYNETGILDITTESDHKLDVNDISQVKLHRLEFTCAAPHAGVSTTFFPEADVVGVGTTSLDYSILRVTPGDYEHRFVGSANNSINGSIKPSDATYSPSTGILELTFASAHNLADNANVTITKDSLTFTCDRDNHKSEHTYPRATDPLWNGTISGSGTTTMTLISPTSFAVNIGKSQTYRFTTQVGTSTIPHVYKGGGTVMPWYGDTTSGGAYRGTTVSIGVTDSLFEHKFVRGISTSFYAASFAGAGHTAQGASYNPGTGELILTVPNHGLAVNSNIGFRTDSLIFTCDKDNHKSEHAYPRSTDPVAGHLVNIDSKTDNTITVNVGTSQGSGAVVNAAVGAGGTLTYNIVSAGSSYFNPSLVIPVPSYAGLGITGVSRLDVGATTDCGTGLLINAEIGKATWDSTTHTFVSATNPTLNVKSGSENGNNKTPSSASYTPSTGVLELTFSSNHGMSTGDTILFYNNTLSFTCDADDNATVHSYPRATDPIAGVTTAITTITSKKFSVNVGKTSFTGITTQFGVTNWEIERNGYGFRRGDVFKLVGLVTDRSLTSPINEAEFTVLDTFNDNFSAWQFGEFDYIDDISALQNGARTRFDLKYGGELLSFEADNSGDYDINLSNALVITVNSIVQEPGVAYEFKGGTSFIFTEPPRPEDNVAIFFYRGSPGSDTALITNVNISIESGDDVQLFDLKGQENQNSRTVSNLSGSNIVETIIYDGPGITSETKSLAWTKQKVDKILDGEVVYKTRDSIEPLIVPTPAIIGDFSSTETSIIHISNKDLFDYDAPFTASVDGFIVDNTTPSAASLTATVNNTGGVSGLTIVDGGKGYVGSTTSLSIALPPSGIGTGIGTTAIATASISNGSISAALINNPGFGYTSTNVPKVLAPLPTYKTETIKLGNVLTVKGFNSNITGIGTTAGLGAGGGAAKLAIWFKVAGGFTDEASFNQLAVGYPFVVSGTSIGSGTTSLYANGIKANSVGIGTTFLDNIYMVASRKWISGGVGVVTCNVENTVGGNWAGVTTTGASYNSQGSISWGALSGSTAFTRGANPVSIGVTGYTMSGLSTFPIIQRRDEGLRDSGGISPN